MLSNQGRRQTCNENVFNDSTEWLAL